MDYDSGFGLYRASVFTAAAAYAQARPKRGYAHAPAVRNHMHGAGGALLGAGSAIGPLDIGYALFKEKLGHADARAPLFRKLHAS